MNNDALLGQMLSQLLAAEEAKYRFPVQVEGGLDWNPATGGGYGGEVRYENPALNLAIRGSGYRAKTPYGNYMGNEVTGGSIEFPTETGLFGVSYDKGARAIDDLIRFYMQKQF